MKPGSRVRVHSKGKAVEGILLPSPASEPGLIMLKLDNGYNIGIDKSDSVKIERLAKGGKLASIPSRTIPHKAGLPEISMIATGGTIGTHVDYLTGGVFMCRTPEEILGTTPELEGVVNIRKMLRPFSIASEDMSYKEWQLLAKTIADELNSGACGVIVTHGTDVLHYTAAALSFMLKNLTKPVILVGAQRSPDRGSFDGSMNLVCAARIAGHSDIGEVSIVMHGSSNDDYCLINRGTKVRKMHSSRRDAFQAVNCQPIGKVWPDGRIEILSDYRKSADLKVIADTAFEPKVAWVNAYPNSDPSIIDWHVRKGCKGIVIEGTGLGHVPTEPLDKKNSWLPHVKKAIAKGVTVVMTTQTIFGRTNPYVYRNLRLMSSLGVIYPGDIMPEVALIKLGWVLAHATKPAEIRKMMMESIAGEITPRSEYMK